MGRLALSIATAIAGCGDHKHLVGAEACVRDGAPPACTPVRGTTLSAREIGEVPGIAVLASSRPADRRLFVVAREGRIRMFLDEQLVPEPFLDLSSVIYPAETVERGLLGLAFHPSYATNGLFFVFYTTPTHATGDLWIGDVGQGRAEELTVLRPGQQNGANLGWSLYEGLGCCATQDDHCLQTAPLPCDPTGLTLPQEVRDRQTPRGAGWASIIGGETYRGTCYPDLVGAHFYADVYLPILVEARLLPDDSLEIVDLPNLIEAQMSSINADARGEIFLTSTAGSVFHLEAGP